MRTNEFLAELSNDKLAKYKTAAAANASKADSEGDFKKGDKRFKGINTATKKQFDNDAKKIKEGVAVDPQQIQQIFKSAQEIQSAGGAANLVGGGNNRTAIGKVKDMFSTPNPVAASGLKQSTSADPSVSAAEEPTTPAGQAAQAARQQRQAAATAALNKGTELVGRPSDGTRTDTGDFSKFPRVQPKPPTTATSALSAIAPKRVPAKPGEVNGLQMRNESFELSESQIYRLIGRIVNEHKKQVDEGILDWAKTKGQNLTTKITADKLLQAWNKANKPTDSDQIADIMIKAGVPQETLNNLFTNFKLPAAKPLPVQPAQPKQGLLGRMAGGVGDAIGSVKGTYAGMKDAYGGGKMTGYDASRANQAMQHVGHTGEVNPETRASAPQTTSNAATTSNVPASRIGSGMSAASGGRGYAPSAGAASGGAGQAAAPSSGPSSFRTVDDAKDAIDDVLDGLNSLKRRNRTAAVSYGAKEFSKLAQQSQQAAAPSNAKQPKPANLRVSGGNPGAPTPDEQANLQRRIDQASGNQTMDEEKQRMDPKCWTGYKKQGTKMKGDTRVNNCVPIKESAILSGVHQVDEGWKSALGSAALAGAMALGGAAHGRVLPDQDPGINRLTGKPVATQVAPSDEQPAAKAPSGYSAEYLQSIIDGSHPRPMLSVEKAKQLLQQQGQQ